jgi:transcription initiation factor TFIIIB Brf1 subunit/transcription initiation factor TFIIB
MSNKPKVEPVMDWFKCPRCMAKTVLHRKRHEDYVCRKCGVVFKADFVKRVTREVTL